MLNIMKKKPKPVFTAEEIRDSFQAIRDFSQRLQAEKREKRLMRARIARMFDKFPLGVRALIWMDEQEAKTGKRPTLTAAGKRFKCHRTTVSRNIKKTGHLYEQYMEAHGESFPYAQWMCEMRAQEEQAASSFRAQVVQAHTNCTQHKLPLEEK